MKGRVITKEHVKLAVVGLIAGLLGGLLGISSGVVIVPALVILLGWDQKLAQGTALAVTLPPIGIFGVLDYYHAGHVRLVPAAVMACGLLFGGYFGGQLAGRFRPARLRRLFAILLFLVGLKMLLGA